MKKHRRAPRWLPFSLELATGLAAALLVTGCERDDPNQLVGAAETTGAAPTDGCPSTNGGTTGGSVGNGATGGTSGGSTGSGVDAPKTVLEQRVTSYTEALRTASFKLVGNAPTLQQIEDLKTATDQPKAYAAMIDAMMSDVRFAKQMIAFWKNTMRMGGAATGSTPSRDTAPTFAARVTFEGQSFANLFMATEHTCPTFDGTQFVDGECPNGPITAGVLTDPGAQAQYYGNLAFRRHRFIQETFVCRKQPSELTDTPIPMGAGSYTSPWPFESIAGADNGGRIDFHDISSAICANCHSTANHRSPLFANFDENGQYQPTIQVRVPVAETPLAVLGDWLPQTPVAEPTAWKFGVPAKDLAEMGAAMAKDDEVAACAVTRIWNHAMSKGDAVIDAAAVPTEVIGPLVTQFKANGYNLRATVRAVFIHEDFVRF